MLSAREYCFRIAGFLLSVRMPAAWDAAALLPSFRPFLHVGGAEGIRLLDCVVQPVQGVQPAERRGVLLDETVNDMGRVRLYGDSDGYLVELSAGPYGAVHLMRASRGFSQVSIHLCTGDRAAWSMLSSLLRIAYSQAVLRHDAVALHASAVSAGGRGYLFLGKSGTGKSTHSALWMRHIPGTSLLNDDNPTVRITGARAYVCGTPWSGKTPCYVDRILPVGGMVRLRQAPGNRFRLQEGADAFAAIYPGCSVICCDEELRSCLYDTVARLAGLVPVGLLCCRPDAEAALLCRSSLCGALGQTETL